MRKWLWTLLTAGALASGVAVGACGDDEAAALSGTPDAGGDSTVTPPGDSSVTATPDSTVGVDAGCTFAGYVISLINTQTTAQALPTTNLGEACAPSISQADFQSLFP